ncbi:membrane-anchored junction protein [Brachionichthys hirsutus]|uniref:membrane-anchored junction protein n=1 Tax=Brachionichthys hirsutus TaxID=412623 RepID=UPI003604B9DB
MPLQAFSFPVPETRFFKAGSFIYKFQLRGDNAYDLHVTSGEEVLRGNRLNQELEDIIRTVLGNLDNLQPFTSARFNVFPCILIHQFIQSACLIRIKELECFILITTSSR